MWTINHGLDKPVALTLVDDDGYAFLADTVILDLNTIRVEMPVPCSGNAYIV